VFFAFLISEGRSTELRSLIVLLSQGAIGMVNLWLTYRTTKALANKSDGNREIARDVAVTVHEVKTLTEKVKETVNGNTPQPGSIPKVPGDI
jgi:hypothetical protein